jgi:hypothetical protein
MCYVVSFKANKSSFKNANNFKKYRDYLSIRTETPKNLPHGKHKMGCSCSIIKSNAMQSSIDDENIKRNNEPLYDMKHLLFEFSVMSEVWAGDNKKQNF